MWQLVKRLGDGLGVPALSPVVPLVVGPEGPTLQLSSRLLAEGMHVPAIRPPTVPPGTCRWVPGMGPQRRRGASDSAGYVVTSSARGQGAVQEQGAASWHVRQAAARHVQVCVGRGGRQQCRE